MQGTVAEMPRIGRSWPSKELLTDLDFTKQDFKKQVMSKDGSRKGMILYYCLHFIKETAV